MTTVNAGALRAYIERIEKLSSEKDDITQDIASVYSEAASFGYDKKIMRKVVAMRKKDDQERMEEDLVLGAYLSALGMQGDLFESDEAA